MIVMTGMSTSRFQKLAEGAATMSGLKVQHCESVNELLESVLQHGAAIAVVDLDFLGDEVSVFFKVVNRLYSSRQVLVLSASAEQARRRAVQTGRGVAHVFTEQPSAATLSAFLTKARDLIETGNMTGHEATV